MLHNSLALKILDFLDVRFGALAIWLFLSYDVTINDLFYPFHTAGVAGGSEFHKRWKVKGLFFLDANKFLNVLGSIQQGDDQLSDESRGRNYFVWLSLTMDVWRNWLRLASWRWFFFHWKFRQRITADSKNWCIKLFVQDITTQLRSFPPSKHPRLFTKGDYPVTLELTKFLRTSPLTKVRLSRLCTPCFCAIPCQPYFSNLATPSQLCWSLSPQSYP